MYFCDNHLIYFIYFSYNTSANNDQPDRLGGGGTAE